MRFPLEPSGIRHICHHVRKDSPILYLSLFVFSLYFLYFLDDLQISRTQQFYVRTYCSKLAIVRLHPPGPIGLVAPQKVNKSSLDLTSTSMIERIWYRAPSGAEVIFCRKNQLIFFMGGTGQGNSAKTTFTRCLIAEGECLEHCH